MDSSEYRTSLRGAIRVSTLIFAGLILGLTALFLAIAIGASLEGTWGVGVLFGFLALFAILPIFVLSYLYAPRKVIVDDTAVTVRSRARGVHFPLARISMIRRGRPEDLKRSFRAFGNGGLFASSGLFHNKVLGDYRAYLTRTDRFALLRVGRTWVALSADDVDGLMAAIEEARPDVASELAETQRDQGRTGTDLKAPGGGDRT